MRLSEPSLFQAFRLNSLPTYRRALLSERLEQARGSECREENNQGVKREGVEASGVELAVMQRSGHYQETKQDGGRYSALSERCAEIIPFTRTAEEL